MKAYGAEICIDCRNFKHLCKIRGLEIDYTDITSSTDCLKAYLSLRDNHPAFEKVKEKGSIGIPYFVNDDGSITMDVDQALSWIGQPPVREDEILEKRPVCASCQ